jgi:hypothetical protein
VTLTPTRRFVAVGVGSLLAGLLVICGYLGALDVRLHHAMDRATATADGIVTWVDPDDDTIFKVRWQDQQEHEHTLRFSVYDSYAKGDDFTVAFDPAHPDRHAFAGDPEERVEADDFEVPMGIAAVVVLGFVAGWGYRGWRFRQVRTDRSAPATATLFSGASNDGSPLTLGRGLWVRLGDEHWQKVMWHPALQDFSNGPVHVHGPLDGRRRVVVELPDGTLLVPTGRLRHRPPKRLELVRERQARIDDDEQWIFPPGTPVPPLRRWWRTPAVLGLVGAGVGAFAGVAEGGAVAAPAFAAGAAALAVNGWAMTSPAP